MKPTLSSGFRRFRGFTLVELMVVLAIASVIAIAMARRAKESAEDSIAVTTADNVKMLGEAFASYMANNTATLDNNPWTTVTVANLQTAGTCGTGRPCLGSFGATAWTGGYNLRVVRVGTSAPYAFEGLACTVNAYTVQGALRGDLAGKVVQAGGGRLGMTWDTTTGAFNLAGGWTASVANYPFTNVAGKVCYFVPQPSAGDIYLRRDGGNTMLGTLNMNSNAISGATTIGATGTISGGAGSFTGAVSGGSGSFTGAVSAGSVSAGSGSFTGNVGAATLSTSGNATIGGAVNATGNVSTNGNFSGQNLTLAAGGTIQAPGRLHIQANENLYLNPWAGAAAVIVGGGGGPGDLTVTDNLTVNNTATVTQDVQITTLTSRANAPSTTSLKALAPTLVEINSVPLNTDGQAISVPTCPNGGSPRIFAIPQTVRGAVNAGNWGADIHIAGAAGGPWNFYAKDANGASLPPVAAPNFIALARIFCAY